MTSERIDDCAFFGCSLIMGFTIAWQGLPLLNSVVLIALYGLCTGIVRKTTRDVVLDLIIPKLETLKERVEELED